MKSLSLFVLPFVYSTEEREILFFEILYCKMSLKWIQIMCMIDSYTKRKIIPLIGKTLEGARNHPVFAEKGHVAPPPPPFPGHNIKQKIPSQTEVYFQSQQQDLRLQGWRVRIKLYLLRALSAPPPHHFHCR